MDYRALAELVMMSFFGLSAFCVALGFSIRVFLAPTLRELFAHPSAPTKDQQLLHARLHQLELEIRAHESILAGELEGGGFDEDAG